jgi:hypothetical protein
MIRSFPRYAWMFAVPVFLAEFLFVMLPAARFNGQLHLGPTWLLTLLGIALILTSVIPALVRLNRRTGGGVVRTTKLLGTAYLGYRVGTAAGRHVYRDITRR